VKRPELMIICCLAAVGLTVWGGVYGTGRMPEWSWGRPRQVVCCPLPPLPSGTALVALTRSFSVAGGSGQQAALIGHDGQVTLVYSDRSAFRRGQIIPWPPPSGAD